MDHNESFEQVVRPHRLDENKEERSLLWSDIKAFANSLTEEQLQLEVKAWGDEKGGGIFSIAILRDDYINPSGEGVEPRSIYTDDPEYKEDCSEENEPAVYEKGQIILELDF
jgi:hypothetical protein